MTTQPALFPASRRTVLRLGSFSLVLGAAGCAASGDVAVGPAAVAGRRPSGFVEMEMVQAAYVEGGGAGRGSLDFRGRRYPFRVVSGGIGGIGASSVQASGDIYGLESLSQFPGAYAQARYGFAAGQVSAGELWLQNEAGVIMRLRARREGLMLSLGGDAVVIQLT
jgi:hypothetical protein